MATKIKETLQQRLEKRRKERENAAAGLAGQFAEIMEFIESNRENEEAKRDLKKILFSVLYVRDSDPSRHPVLKYFRVKRVREESCAAVLKYIFTQPNGENKDYFFMFSRSGFIDYLSSNRTVRL